MSQTLRQIANFLQDIKDAYGIPDSPRAHTGRGGFASNMDPASLGVHNSGVAVFENVIDAAFPAGKFKPLLNCIGDPSEVNRGLATVHVNVQETTSRAFAGSPNQKVLLKVKWGTGRGGGECLVDAPRGTCFTVAGAQVVTAEVALVNANTNDANAFSGANDLRIEAAVQWGSTTFQPAYFTGPKVTVEADGGISAAIPIPDHARKIGVLVANPLSRATVNVGNIKGDVFFYAGVISGGGTDSAGVSHVYIDDKLPIVSGAGSIKVQVSTGTTFFPVWELWI